MIGVLVVLVVAVIGGIIFINKLQATRPYNGGLASIPDIPRRMKLASTAFKNNGQIPAKYTCDGENISPPLSITELPQGTQSLVLIVDDPDAPVGTFTHWLVWNIDPQTTLISEGNVPEFAVQGKNDFGKNEWGGPCPPSGTHHYQFELHALDQKLDFAPTIDKDNLEKAMQGHILSYAQLIGLYQRNP